MEAYNEFLIFCKNIRTLRGRQDLTEREMAKILHVSVKTLSMLENGVFPTHTSANIIFRLSRAFQISPKDLFSLL